MNSHSYSSQGQLGTDAAWLDMNVDRSEAGRRVPPAFAKHETGVFRTRGRHDESTSRDALAIGALGRRPTADAPLDAVLLSRATEIIEGVDPGDPRASQIALEGLASVFGDLWASALQSQRNRQELLALAEQAAISWDSLRPDRVRCLRETIVYLGGQVVSGSHLDVMRSVFLDCGWKPLSITNDGNEANLAD